ncbi:hypothetical protein G7Y89_g8603 [Cudoniella acicularis]|uniref:Uncharacterized protein n=1 Tax=Cudoniella acicularis TaxID=354080 RepID=A0A8H4W0G9_9HELO|nr:hypothetical protein G7Y89_g8603 [Cudoniella acicularis]
MRIISSAEILDASVKTTQSTRRASRPSSSSNTTTPPPPPPASAESHPLSQTQDWENEVSMSDDFGSGTGVGWDSLWFETTDFDELLTKADREDIEIEMVQFSGLFSDYEASNIGKHQMGTGLTSIATRIPTAGPDFKFPIKGGSRHFVFLPKFRHELATRLVLRFPLGARRPALPEAHLRAPWPFPGKFFSPLSQYINKPRLFMRCLHARHSRYARKPERQTLHQRASLHVRRALVQQNRHRAM